MVNSRFRSQFLETRLKARESQLELAADASKLGFWTLEPTTGELSWSARCQALLNVAADTPAVFESLISRAHPDDQMQVRRAFLRAIQLKREFSVEFRVRTGDASTRQVRCIGRPHISTVNREQLALSGLVQALPEASANDASKQASRIGAIVQRMESLREIERNTLVNRMNSEVSRSLALLRQRLDSLASRNDLPDGLCAELTLLADEAEEGMDAVRRAMFEMRPPGVEELGFAGALERYASEQAAAAGIELSLTCPTDSLPIGAPAQEALYVVARAGIDNVVQHARAKHMSVTVSSNQNEVVLKIVDDGIGICNADLMKESALGLFASSERIAGAGGELRVSGDASRGTTLEVSIALRRETRPLQHNQSPMSMWVA